MARTDGRHPRVLSDEEIAKRGGLDVEVVRTIQHLTSWHGVNLATMRKYLKGCTMDFENAAHMRRTDQYARKRLLQKMAYLKKDNEWHTRWKPMRDRWLEAVQTLALKR